MADWQAKISDFYAGLGVRDQQVVNWGVPVILLLVLYLLIGRPLVNGYLDVTNVHRQLRADLAWLSGQEDLLLRFNSPCSLAIDPVQSADVEFVVTGQARRLGLEPRIAAAGAQSYNMQLTAAAGNAVLSLVHELACRGLQVTSLEMNSNANGNGLVDASLGMSLL